MTDVISSITIKKSCAEKSPRKKLYKNNNKIIIEVDRYIAFFNLVEIFSTHPLLFFGTGLLDLLLWRKGVHKKVEDKSKQEIKQTKNETDKKQKDTDKQRKK